MFSAFDYPRRSPPSAGARCRASAALVMLNNPFVLQQAELWAKRTLAAPNRSAADRVREMYESAFGRMPTKDELTAAVEFVKDQAAESGKTDDPKAWTDLAHVLFNTKAFIFVE